MSAGPRVFAQVLLAKPVQPEEVFKAVDKALNLQASFC